MNILLLPGTSKTNKEWIDKVDSKLSNLFEKSKVVYYRHWRDGSKMDMNYEVNKLEDVDNELGEFCIFAKSAGTILTLLAVDKDILHPKFAIFTGTAVHFARNLGIDLEKVLSRYSTPTYYIQKSRDPAGSFDELEVLVKKSGSINYTLKEIEGSDHFYGDLELMHGLTGEYFNSKSRIIV